MQVERQTRLLRALQIAGSAELQVRFGNAETVVGGDHDVHPLARLLGEFDLGEQDAITLVGTAPHPAPQLVELAQTETLGVLDNHNRGIGDIDSDLYDRGRHHDLRLAADETLHLEVLLLGFHLPMDHGEGVAGERFAEFVVTVLQVLHVQFFVLLDEREDDINLTPRLYLLCNELIDRDFALYRIVERVDGFAPGGQLVDDTDAEVAIDRHREGAGDGGSRHDQDMGRADVLAPQFGTLRDAETVLLVHDDEAEVAPLDGVFQEGMGADEDVDFTVLQGREECDALFLGRGAREQCDADLRDGGEERAERLKVLISKDFRRCHDARLVAIVHREEAAHERDEGLAAADIALKEAVHLLAGLEVGLYVADDPFLRVGERERKRTVKRVERPADKGHGVARVLLATLHPAENLQLDEKQLLELEAHARLLHGLRVLGEMDVEERLRERHKAVALQKVRAEGVGHAQREVGEQARDDGA